MGVLYISDISNWKQRCHSSRENLQYFTALILLFVNLRLFRHFETVTNIRTWIKSQILENVVRCKYFEVGVHIKMV